MTEAQSFVLKDSHNRQGRTYGSLHEARQAVRATVPMGARWEIRRLLKDGATSAFVTSGRRTG